VEAIERMVETFAKTHGIDRLLREHTVYPLRFSRSGSH